MAFVDDCLAFAGPVWDQYLHHPWIEAMFAGKLSPERFHYWIAQDLPHTGDRSGALAFLKVPADNPWGRNIMEYILTFSTTRMESHLIEKYGEFARTRWAARPAREAFQNFLFRAAVEGNFGEICCSWYPCDAFCDVFGKRYLEQRPRGLPEEHVRWLEQWIDEFFVKHLALTTAGINEYGAHGTEYERERMRWTFLRAVQHQMATFDAAWNLSDPWPGEGRELSIMAGAPAAKGG